MATNPVFNRINKETQGYAGFGQGPGPSGAPAQAAPGQPGTPQGMPIGYPGASETMSPQQLEEMYRQAPAGPAQTGRLTLDDVVIKALGLFAIVVVVAAATWLFIDTKPTLSEQASTASPIWLVGMFGSLALSFVIAFRKQISVPLILLHAVLQGAFIGAISQSFNAAWSGIVGTALLATVGTFIGMFLGWKFGIIKVTSKSRRIFGMAAMGYLVFLLLNIGAGMLGFGDGWGIYNGGLGIAVSLLGVGLASYSLAVDFDSVNRAVAAGAPEKYSWLLGHGLVASLVWLYIEFLRLFAIMNRN